MLVLLRWGFGVGVCCIPSAIEGFDRSKVFLSSWGCVFLERKCASRDSNQMAPGSATCLADGHAVKQYRVVHETSEQWKVVGAYPTEEEAYSAALYMQMGVFRAMQESMVGQVLRVFPERSLEWKLRMLQDAMEAYFLDVGFEALTDYFSVTDEIIVSDAAAAASPARKRKMHLISRGETKLAKSNTSCGFASTISHSSMSRYMYQTSPFGMS